MVSMENPGVCCCNPSEKYEFVSWDDYSQYCIWENEKCSKPPTRWKFKPKMLKFWVCGVLGLGLWFLGSTLLKIHRKCWTAVRGGPCRPLSSHLFGIDECATQAGLNVAKGYLAWKQLQGRKPETHARKCIHVYTLSVNTHQSISNK